MAGSAKRWSRFNQLRSRGSVVTLSSQTGLLSPPLTSRMKTIFLVLGGCLVSFSSFGQSQGQLNQAADAAYRQAD